MPSLGLAFAARPRRSAQDHAAIPPRNDLEMTPKSPQLRLNSATFGAHSCVTDRQWADGNRRNHTMAQILPNLQQQLEAMQAEMAALKADNAKLEAALTAKATAKISFKVGPSGGISVYGLGRFPVTLYISQWNALFDAIPRLQAFAKANVALLKTKG